MGCVDGARGASCDGGDEVPATWVDALSACQTLVWAGEADWYVPNPKELRSIVDNRRSNPSIDIAAFPTANPVAVWSSTTYEDASSEVFIVDFADGAVDTVVKDSSLLVRCVRRR